MIYANVSEWHAVACVDREVPTGELLRGFWVCSFKLVHVSVLRNVLCIIQSVVGKEVSAQLLKCSLLKRIISNNSYAHDDQGDNPGQENRGLDGVLYKL